MPTQPHPPTHPAPPAPASSNPASNPASNPPSNPPPLARAPHKLTHLSEQVPPSRGLRPNPYPNLTLSLTRCLRQSRPTRGRWACVTCYSSSGALYVLWLYVLWLTLTLTLTRPRHSPQLTMIGCARSPNLLLARPSQPTPLAQHLSPQLAMQATPLTQ